MQGKVISQAKRKGMICGLIGAGAAISIAGILIFRKYQKRKTGTA